MELCAPHPYGVFPTGNIPPDFDFATRLGKCLASFGPALLGDFLYWLDARSLTRLAAASASLYAIVHSSSEVWRTLVLSQQPPRASVEYRESWRFTAIRSTLIASHVACPDTCSDASIRDSIAQRHPWYDDTMFQSWLCTVMTPAFEGRAKATRRSALPPFKPVPREAAIDVPTFKERYERANVPVILTDIARHWPLFKILNGTFTNLSAKRGEIERGTEVEGAPPPLYRCENTVFSLEEYVRYAETQMDERPLYLFDANFMNQRGFREGLWHVPPHFAQDDLFAALGDARPQYRWLIAGPKRAGSSFHIDPNYTNAWNACLTGRKRWLLFPPGNPPPGVRPSADMSEVATPVSLTEWLLNYYEVSRSQLHATGYECVCEAGEIMFVPAGWWHFVINLEPSVAITQNYVCDSNLKQVLRFLKGMPRSISGIGEDGDRSPEDVDALRRDLHAVFSDAVTRYRPDLSPIVHDALTPSSARCSENRKRPPLSQLIRLDDLPRQPEADSDSAGFVFEF